MKILTIMPDFGMGPYAWLKHEDDGTTLVGGNIADCLSGFEGSEFAVSAALEESFVAWMHRFGSGYNDPAFDWPAFHHDGIELARRLKREIGDQARVIYSGACEDPAYVRTERTEILADGSLKHITVCKPHLEE